MLLCLLQCCICFLNYGIRVVRCSVCVEWVAEPKVKIPQAKKMYGEISALLHKHHLLSAKKVLKKKIVKKGRRGSKRKQEEEGETHNEEEEEGGDLSESEREREHLKRTSQTRNPQARP